MKKVLSVLLAIIFAFSSLGASTAVFAADSQKNKLIAHLDEQIKGAANFAFKGVTFTEQNANRFLTYIDSGADVSAFKTEFLKSVKANLDENSGKLMSTDWEGKKSENIGMYGAVILDLRALGYDPENFEGYNIVKAFDEIDLTAEYNPYNFRVAILAAGSNTDALASKLTTEYYEMGKGLNYWGYSCDNTCQYITAVSPVRKDYEKEITDAKAVVQTYTKENGAYADNTYVPDVNADSTALALMAYSALGELDKAFEYYEDLIMGFESSTGVFQTSGVDNAYATEEALLAFEYFKTAIEKQNYEHPRHIYTETVTTNATTKEDGYVKGFCAICGEEKIFETIAKPKTVDIAKPKKVAIAKTSYKYTGKKITPKVTVTDSNGNKIDAKYYTVKYYNNKAVGKATIKVTLKDLYSGTLTKTFKIIPKNVAKFTVKKGKKSFTANWKKQTKQTTGYQLQYSTKNNFKSKKTVNIKKNKVTKRTVKKLKSKKTYYVRIRTYKTVNGKKYYSSWSKVKTVKIK